MDPAVAIALAHLKASHHVLWGEVKGEDRSILIDLTLDGLADLGYHEGKPYAFVITDDGRRALQAWEMGDV